MENNLMNIFSALGDAINKNLIREDRYLTLLDGIKNTLIMAIGATILGIIIGLAIAIVKVYAKQNKDQRMNCTKPAKKDRSKKNKTRRNRFSYTIWRILEVICDIYLTVIRGTPIVVQLMIMYYIVFVTAQNPIPVAILAFGINSGAYVAEIVRAGIMAVDKGQMEAGRSLGFTSSKTMRLIILPQAIKNILPALGNEFITLLKETSVAGYVAIVDITKAGDIIRSRTYEAFFPLILVALIYLIMVVGLTSLFNLLERRLSKGDNR